MGRQQPLGVAFSYRADAPADLAEDPAGERRAPDLSVAEFDGELAWRSHAPLHSLSQECSTLRRVGQAPARIYRGTGDRSAGEPAHVAVLRQPDRAFDDHESGADAASPMWHEHMKCSVTGQLTHPVKTQCT